MNLFHCIVHALHAVVRDQFLKATISPGAKGGCSMVSPLITSPPMAWTLISRLRKPRTTTKPSR